jgi:flagellar basal-body rod protein FlgB
MLENQPPIAFWQNILFSCFRFNWQLSCNNKDRDLDEKGAITMNRVFFDDPAINRMERYMDGASRRQSLIASNLSNIDTPGYKTVDVSFEGELKSALSPGEMVAQVTNDRHLTVSIDSQGDTLGRVREVEGLTLRNDLNNVNIDREMARMSMNSMMFSAIAQLITKKFNGIKSAILEGR